MLNYKRMNDTELQTAIAVILGYTFEDKSIQYDGETMTFRVWRSPSGGGMEKDQPPNYPGDLNACHEAEEHIIEKGVNAWWTYVGHLLRNNPTPLGQETAVHATARQRAEALYLTLK